MNRTVSKPKLGKHARQLAALLAALLIAPAAADTVAVKAKRVYTSAGDPLDNAVVLIRDGKIEAVGAVLTIPDDARVIELPNSVVTPGLVDAMCVIDSQVPQAGGSGRRQFSDCGRCAQAHSDHAYVAPIAGGAGCVECTRAHRGHDCASCRSAEGGTCTWHELARKSAEQADLEHVHEQGGCGWPCGGLPPGQDGSGPLASAIGPRTTWAEHSSEFIPHLNVIDSVNLLSKDFDRLLRSGVTTVFISPDSASVIGTRGAVVKTGGDLGKRIVNRADAVKATIATDPSDRGRSNDYPPGYGPDQPTFMTRRPMSRMGVYWGFRKAFYDAQRDGRGLAVSGADAPPEAALPVLREILAGRIALRIQSRMQHDVFSALRLADEFGLKFILEEATEAYQCLTALKDRQVPVIFGPTFIDARGYRRVAGEADDPRLNTPKQLYDAGIKFALTAQEMRDEESLPRQAMYAVRYGLPADAALAAVTSTPAELMGLAGRVGTLAAGADADLVVWSDEPLGAASRPLLVMIDGQVVYEE